MKYYMFRLYTLLQEDGTVIDKTATYVFTDEISALKQYYKMLATDIDDESKPMVLCAVMTDGGIVIAKQKFIHSTNQTATIESENTEAEE